MIGLLCPRCHASLDAGDGGLVCTNCGTRYPVVDGVPRLLERDFYWGEIDKFDARLLVERAKTVGWRAAVGERFSNQDAAWISILDLQRASWTPLLGLPKESVVLDVGSGYGAITHALAANYDEVHSVEAIPERVEFTRVRLNQEGLTNVQLIQGSALNLPYPSGSFDAIIVNGVLEWIGDWDLEGNPRSAQLRFLQRLYALLKPSGRLLVGIENRIGYVTFAGALDHSGLPFTNLLPRPLATLAIRMLAKKHHRMEAPSRSYRTYTYSEAGYRTLFREAGFTSAAAYWAEPGYNVPYRLTSLQQSAVAATLVESQVQGPNRGDVSLKGRLKRVLARTGLFKHVVPDFIFIISKSHEREAWRSLLPGALSSDPEVRLTTYGFAKKTTIRVTAPSQNGVVLKCSTPAEGSRELIAEEYDELQAMAALSGEERARWPFAVPAPLGERMLGRHLVTAESHAVGKPVATIFYRLPPEARLAFLRQKLPALAETSSIISRLAEPTPPSAQSWLDAVQTRLDPELAHRTRSIGRRYEGWRTHGDFTVENVIIDTASEKLTVIDWEFVRTGVPPLYDLITLYFSIIAGVPTSAEIDAKFDDKLTAQFYMCFFHANPWSALFAETIARECERLAIDRAQMWDIFVDALLFRIGYLLERGSNVAESRIKFVSMMHAWKSEFQL